MARRYVPSRGDVVFQSSSNHCGLVIRYYSASVATLDA